MDEEYETCQYCNGTGESVNEKYCLACKGTGETIITKENKNDSI